MNVYDRMRRERKEEILKIGKSLICNLGFHNATMKELAEMLKISRKTLYKYYSSIDKLAYDIEINILTNMCKELSSIVPLKGSAVEKFEIALKSYFSFSVNNPKDYLYISLFDAYYNSHPPDKSLLTNYKESIQGLKPLYMSLYKLLEEGINDKSMRDDLNIGDSVTIIFNVLMGVTERLAVLGSGGSISESEIDITITGIIKMLTDFLKA